jgi:hypothetical protein
MIATLNFHDTKKITSQACHRGGTHWLEIVLRQGESNFPITIFLDDPALADAYAAAINGVQAAQPAKSGSDFVRALDQARDALETAENSP